MNPIPLLLPLRANEAAALADLVYSQLEGQPLTAVARRHNAMLSFANAGAAQMELIGIATGGRFHYRMQGGEEAIRLAASCLLGKTV